MIKKAVIMVILLSVIVFPALLYAGEIHDACKAGDLNKVKAMLEKDPSLLQSKTEEGKSPLHMATGGGQVEVIKYLLSIGADINARNNNGGTPIHVAASQNQPECAKILIAAGAKVNDIRVAGGMTPLHIAVMKDNYEVAVVLVENGADVSAMTQSGMTPLQIAMKKGNQKMITLLKSKGAK